MWIWQAVAVAAALVASICYIRGRRNAYRFTPHTVNGSRLAAWCFAIGLLLAAFAWPLPQLAQTHILARTGQLICIAFLGAPILWLSLPFHFGTLGAPVSVRRVVARLLVRPSVLSPLLAFLTQPFFVWFFYLCMVLLWHDPAIVRWTMQSELRQHLALIPLLIAALLFWQQITMMGPRRYTRTPPLARFGMLIAVEIPNVVVGITLAFAGAPFYDFYSTTELNAIAAGSAFSQQTMSGALVWVFGSMVYIVSIVLVVNEIFRREGIERPDPPANWDSDERFIAPGLEGRLREAGRVPHDWKEV